MLESSEKNNEDDNDFPQQIEDINESPQLLIDRLRNELKKSYAEIVRLKAKISDDKSDNNDGNDFYNQRNELLKMLSHKNSTIQRMSSDILILQTQLKEAVTAKFDALVRLDAVDGKELTLQFKEKQMEMNNENLQHLKHNLEMTDASLDQQVDMENYRKLQNVDNEIPTMSPPTPPTTNVDMGPTSSKCIDLLNDESDTALELLKQVRTRRQTHFVLQALNGSDGNTSGSVRKELVTRNDKKGRVKKQANSPIETTRRNLPCFVKLSKV